ncbi:restriction endonuclease subunit S [Aeromonas caviae]|uniref:restriction endonuclease subunit S n=2 Tax=Aeromonas caviae TaxID=648 RepID=UPI0029D9CB37|nr:restriction endonuclease subunit S [Aeromonas caviae]MDX7702666.1 restriction endonuclease subunit S [Aeromonas caviae]MDX7754320.1 restriction endonuclease subunit S [Aeromonas caviae]MDX7775379.1 restriction endonuclease subunit S [Aeromonas caviae]
MTLTAMPKYEVYKDSGVDWLSNIPAHWQPLANKHIFKIRKTLVGKRSKQYDLLSLTLRGVIKRDMENPEGKFPAEFDTYQEVNSGDFVFCLFDVEETPRTVGLSQFNGMITGAYTVFEVDKSFNKKFLYYFYLNLDQDKRLKPLYRGLRNTIPKDAFMAFKTFIPPQSEQTAIANFLDAKTTQIDEAIAIKEQQIALLNERKQILIQQAVIKGLNQNVPMKKSGVDWVGDIPEHWSLQPGFIVFNENKKSNKGMIESQVLSLSYGKIIVKAKEKLNGLVPESFETYQVVSPGNIIIRCTDLQNDKTSLRTGFVKNHGIITSAYLCLNISLEQNAEYIHYFLHALDVCKEIYRYGSGLRQSLSFSDFKRMLVITPPIEEQDQIVTFIREQEENIMSAVELLKAQIEKLTEYKKSLIHSAVTGNIKVV